MSLGRLQDALKNLKVSDIFHRGLSVCDAKEFRRKKKRNCRNERGTIRKYINVDERLLKNTVGA
jgi:hypothetical protein